MSGQSVGGLAGARPLLDGAPGTVTAAEAAGPGVELPVSGWDGYRPYLDGLRAVAVYLVVLFHAGVSGFDGGFVGVDVFFVLSGYLVTRLLLRDLHQSGSISYARFYSRRFRRLLPAAFVTLVVTAMVFTAIASPVEVLDAVGSFKAAFLYVTNWYFIAQSADYFGADLSANPVLHFWSLAVEEQFYLLWPLLLGGLFVATRRLGNRQLPILRLTVAAGAAASLAWAWTLKSANPNRAYYGTDARAYQLLAGALLALTPAALQLLARHRHPTRWTSLAALAALIALSMSWLHTDAITRGTLITILTVTLIAGMEALSGGPAGRLLSIDPLTYLGKISYGTYLWHWPVILVITRTVHPATWSTFALTALIATGLASLSYQILEHPIRASTLLDRHRRTVITAGLTTSILAAIILIPAITNPPTTTAITTTTTGFTPIPTGLNWQAIKNDYPKLPNCEGKPVEACTLVHGTGPHLLLIGDSHAGMMIPALESLAASKHLTLSVSVKGGCPWQQGLFAVPVDVGGAAVTPADCKRVRDDTYNRVIPTLKPDIIVAMNSGYEQPTQLVGYLDANQHQLSRQSPDYERILDDATTSSIQQLEADGRKVVLLEPIPFTKGVDPLTCLSQASVIEACRYVVNDQPTALEQTYRRLDKQDDQLWSFDLDRAVCPFLPICDPIVDAKVVKIDRTHLTSSFSAALGPTLDALFDQNGVLRP